MNPARLASLSAEWRVKREALLEAFPELRDDPDALTDSLDGEASALDAVAWLIRVALETDADVAAVKGLSTRYRNRAERLAARGYSLRLEAQRLMESIGETRLVRPEFTVSIRPGVRSVHISALDRIPDDLVTVHRQPDKGAIRAALDEGREVPGASLSNGQSVLSVRIS